MGKWLLPAALLVLLAGPVRAADPFVIYALFPMTGPAAFFGTEEAKGIAMVEASVNKAGGINGRPVKFVIQDNQSNTLDRGVADGPVAWPPIRRSCSRGDRSRRAWPRAACSKPTGRCSSARARASRRPRAATSSPLHRRRSIKWKLGSICFRLRGLTKFATLTATEAVGQDFDRHVDDVMANPRFKGMTVVAREHFNFTDLSVNAQIERIKNAGAQAIFSYTNGTAMGTVFRALRDVAPTIPILICSCDLSYILLERFASVLPNEVDVLAYPAYAPDAIPNRRDPVRRAVDAMYDAMRTAGLPRLEIGSVVQWNEGNLAVTALRKVGVTATGHRNCVTTSTALPLTRACSAC